MTVNEAILRADELRPNPFDEKQKARWLSELDGKIAKEILNKDGFEPYDISNSGETELLAEDAYGDLYLFYLCAMIDFFSRDYGEYNNSIAMFTNIFSAFAKAKKSSGEIKKSGRESQYYKNIF